MGKSNALVRFARAFGFALVALLSTSAAYALSTPERDGYVTDQANLLDRGTITKLNEQLEGLTRRSGGEVVVVTLKSLEGVSIETWGDMIGETWGIGGSAHNGILLIVAPNDRKVRIAVGTGVQYRFSDDLAASIVANKILPRFKAGDFAGGVVAGVDGIDAALNLESSGQSTSSSSTSASTQPSVSYPSSSTRPSYNVYPAPDYPLGNSSPSSTFSRQVSIGSQAGSIVTWVLNHIVLIIIIVVIAYFVYQVITNAGSLGSNRGGYDPWYDDNRWGRNSWGRNNSWGGGSWGSSSWGGGGSGGGSWHSSSSSSGSSSHSSSPSSSSGGGGRSFGGGASGSW